MNDTLDKPRAYAGSSAGDQAAVGRAVQWASSIQPQVGGSILLHVPGKQNLRADPAVERLSKTLPVSTWRAPANAWSGGPVISAWPDRGHLATIDDDVRTRALVVIGWSDRDVAAWITAHRPQMLNPEDTTPAGPKITDPVVIQGLETLTVLVNHGNNLAGTLDRRDAINVLTVLHRGGHTLDPEAIYGWSLADPHWHASGAERLRDLAAAISEGRRPRGGDPTTLRSDILDVWRAEAAAADS